MFMDDIQTDICTVQGSLASTSAAAERSNAPPASPKGPATESPTLWIAYFFAIMLPVMWLFTSYLASSTFHAHIKISENGTTGYLFNTTGGHGPQNITTAGQEILS